MFGLWGGNPGEQRSAVSADFEHALTQEVLRTELARIKALIVTTSLLVAILWTVYILEPDAVNHIWRGRLRPAYLYLILIPFILFELWVHAVIRRQLKLHRDVPVFRRYFGALIETTMPTIALASISKTWGRLRRSDLWCRWHISSSSFSRRCGSTFGSRPLPVLSRRLSCSGWRCSIILPSIPIEPNPISGYHAVAQPDHSDLRHTGGRRRSSVAPPVRSQHRGRHRA